MSQKRKSLEEGALAFFKSTSPQAEETSKISTEVPLSSILLPEQQPRRYFDPQKMQQLVASVQEHGILEPLLVRPAGKDQYELVAGERRYRAAKEVSLVKVPIVVRAFSNEEALQVALIENLHREDLNPVEETEAILQLLALKLNLAVQEATSLLYRMYNEVKGNVNSSNPNVRVNDESLAVQEIFGSLGLMTWESFVKNRLPLLKLPEEILEALRQGTIAYTKAQAIARIKDPDKRRVVLEEAIAKDLSLNDIRGYISSLRHNEEEAQSLKVRMNETYRRFQKAKLWDDPKKQKQIAKLLSQMEAILSEQ